MELWSMLTCCGMPRIKYYVQSKGYITPSKSTKNDDTQIQIVHVKASFADTGVHFERPLTVEEWISMLSASSKQGDDGRKCFFQAIQELKPSQDYSLELPSKINPRSAFSCYLSSRCHAKTQNQMIDLVEALVSIPLEHKSALLRSVLTEYWRMDQYVNGLDRHQKWLSFQRGLSNQNRIRFFIDQSQLKFAAADAMDVDYELLTEPYPAHVPEKLSKIAALSSRRTDGEPSICGNAVHQKFDHYGGKKNVAKRVSNQGEPRAIFFEETKEGSVYKYSAMDLHSQEPVTILEWAQTMAHDKGHATRVQMAQLSAPFRGMFFETKGATFDSAKRQQFEFALVNSPELYRMGQRGADPHSFAEHFYKCGKQHAATFENLGGDAQLVAPTPPPRGSDMTAYSHLANFCRNAPEQQVLNVWKTVASEYLVRLQMKRPKPVWLSTSGLGVAWLHFRMDSRPKYYQYSKFAKEDGRNSANARSGYGKPFSNKGMPRSIVGVKSDYGSDGSYDV